METKREDPTYSIIITVEDGNPALHRCIQSCINQAYENLEIIVSAYGKPFDTHSSSSDDRIHILPAIASSISAARNSALHTAKGTYVLFLESTDEIHHLWLEKALERFQLSQADAVQCATVYEKEALTGAVHLPNDALMGFHQRLLCDHIISLGSLIVKKSICKHFPEEMGILGDWKFWIETLRNRKVDVISEYYGHIAQLAIEEAKKQHAAYPRQRLAVMKEYYPELRFSVRKLRQSMRIKALERQLKG